MAAAGGSRRNEFPRSSTTKGGTPKMGFPWTSTQSTLLVSSPWQHSQTALLATTCPNWSTITTQRSRCTLVCLLYFVSSRWGLTYLAYVLGRKWPYHSRHSSRQQGRCVSTAHVQKTQCTFLYGMFQHMAHDELLPWDSKEGESVLLYMRITCHYDKLGGFSIPCQTLREQWLGWSTGIGSNIPVAFTDEII